MKKAILLTAILAASCGSSSDKICEPGDIVTCPCTGADDSTQTCLPDGSGWGECDCPCQPDCAGKDCGPDGCGGECGECIGCEGVHDPNLCVDAACMQVCCPDCTGRECGDDGCAGMCGMCKAHEICDQGQCACLFESCLDACCADSEVCFDDACCAPDCYGRECGDDGCGGQCGECIGCEGVHDPALCLDGICAMVCCPDCSGRECGPDGCGGICGTCTDPETCNQTTGLCECGPGCAGCGNGVIEAPELCDGDDLGGVDCLMLGLGTGTLVCRPDCQGFDTGLCTERCDGTSVCNTCLSCAYLGPCFTQLDACTTDPDCSDLDKCLSSCSPGDVDCENQCYFLNPGGLDLWNELFECATCQECQLDCEDFSGGCTIPLDCGNGTLDTGEACDGTELRGLDCASLGYVAGTLACRVDCRKFDTSGCVACGNGVIEAPEVCDGDDLGGLGCLAFGLNEGVPSCNPDCTGFDTWLCMDGCDGTGDCFECRNCANLGPCGPLVDACWAIPDCPDLDTCLALCPSGDQDCEDQCYLQYPDGIDPLNAVFECNTCDQCLLDCDGLSRGCTVPPDCGNDTLDPGEACDGAQLRGLDCASLGFNTGTLACRADCRKYDTTGCATVDGPTAVIEVTEGTYVATQTSLHLIGSNSFAASGRSISRYEWAATLQPVGSYSVFWPSASDPDPTFEVNVAGQYFIRLMVWDDTDTPAADPAYVLVQAVPDETVHIELLWDTPGDPDPWDMGPEAGSDLDLHFLHPAAAGVDCDGDGQPDDWFDNPWDCFWFNPSPDWGSPDPGVDDDPSLDRDDTDGAGPEIVTLEIPEDGMSYRIGVHTWNDHGFGPSYATVRVYVDGWLVYEATDVEMVNHDMWEVGSLEWPGGYVIPSFGNDGGPKILPECVHPLFGP